MHRYKLIIYNETEGLRPLVHITKPTTLADAKRTALNLAGQDANAIIGVAEWTGNISSLCPPDRMRIIEDRAPKNSDSVSFKPLYQWQK